MATNDSNPAGSVNLKGGQFEEQLAETRTLGRSGAFKNPTALLLGYWVLCAAIGLLFLRDELFNWKVGQSWQVHWFWAVLALAVTIAAQIAYMQVARHDGRPLSPSTTLVFIIINGVLEALVFMVCYKLLFLGAKLVFGDLDVINFTFGFLGFVLYSGFIHGFFWARLIPPHFSAEPRLQGLRKLLTPIQACIVLAWCVYFYYTGDIWTIVFLHIIIDVVLMTWVRPPVLFAAPRRTEVV